MKDRCYQTTTEDTHIAAEAFALAGVLAAADSSLPQEPEQKFQEILDKATHKTFVWSFPHSTGANTGDSSLTDTELSEIWRRLSMAHFSTGGCRLHILPGAAGVGELREIVKTLLYPLRLHISRGQRHDHEETKCIVASVAVLTRQTVARHEWRWPVRTAVSKHNPALSGDMTPFARGWARLGSAGDFKYRQDLFVRHFAPPGHIAPPGQGTGLAIQICPPTVNGVGVIDRHVKKSLVDDNPAMRPEFLFCIESDSVWEFFKEFVKTLSHDQAPDIALYSAYYRLHPTPEEPPVLLAPAIGFVEDMEAARLSRRLHDLVARISRLKNRSALDALVMVRRPHVFGLASDTLSLRELRDQLAESLQGDRVLYRFEEDVGENIEPLEEQTNRIEKTRYLDPTIYPGHLSKYERPDRVDPIPDIEPLESESEFTLELAIRAEPIGIGKEQDARAVKYPRREGKKNLKIYARVRSYNEDILKFEDKLLPFNWPYLQDSETVFFHFKTLRPKRRTDTVDIEIRLYSFPDLRLFELMEIRDVVIGESNESKLIRRKHWPSRKPTRLSVEETEQQVVASFHVMAEAGGYTFEAALKQGDELKLIPAGHTISVGSIEGLLTELREFWKELAKGKSGQCKNLTSAGYGKKMDEMWRYGGRAWELLFGRGKAGQARDAERLGNLIAKINWPKDSVIEVSYQEGKARNFVFPWSILRPLGKKPVDPSAFWGIKYLVGPTDSKGPNPYLSDEPVSIVSLIDKSFADHVNPSQMLNEVTSANRWGYLTEISTKEELIEKLEQSPPAQLFYFFCHGYVPDHRASLPAATADFLRHKMERHEDSEPWQILINTLDRGSRDAMMFFGFGALRDSELGDLKISWEPRRPIVFLNMCHSANLMPSTQEGLARRFMDSSAAAVIGTESEMTACFADIFAREVIGKLANQENIGMAVLNARRHFHDQRNPLGFVYTLYGRWDAKLGAKS